jgi:ferrous iron transport protein A
MMVTLDLLKNNKEFIVRQVLAGWRAKTRLANLGIVPGTKIKKLRSAPLFGPIQVKVKGSDLVIGRGLARKIQGEEIT